MATEKSVAFFVNNNMIEVTLNDSNFSHQKCLSPFFNSSKSEWKRDGIRRKINVYTDNFIKSSIIEVPKDGNYNVCVLLEPLTNPRWTDIYDYIQTDFEKFDLIISHNKQKLQYLFDTRPDKFYYSTHCITQTWLYEHDHKLHTKSNPFKIWNHFKEIIHHPKKISMPFSHKNRSEGHRFRHLFYEKHKNHEHIDFWGGGLPVDNNYHYWGPEIFMSYKYTIVIENCLEKGFISEKFNDALLTGCIPIYWGAEIEDTNYDMSSIFQVAPKKEIIDFNFEESFALLENMVEYIVKNDPYDSLYESVIKNYNYALSHRQSEDNIYEVLKIRGMIK